MRNKQTVLTFDIPEGDDLLDHSFRDAVRYMKDDGLTREQRRIAVGNMLRYTNHACNVAARRAAGS